MVVSCETAREINDITIDRMLQANDMETFRTSLATLTGGSGTIAVLLTRRFLHARAPALRLYHEVTVASAADRASNI